MLEWCVFRSGPSDQALTIVSYAYALMHIDALPRAVLLCTVLCTVLC